MLEDVFVRQIVVHEHMGYGRVSPVPDPRSSMVLTPLDADLAAKPDIVIRQEVCTRSAKVYIDSGEILTESKSIEDTKTFCY